MKRRKGFMSNTVAELDRLNTRETQLVAGLAKLTAFVATEGDTAMDALNKFYPSMRDDLKTKVSDALQPILDNLYANSSS
jgi:hypothetical protein